MMRFDRFTERAQDAAMRAYEVLQRYGHSQVDTEHLLLSLISWDTWASTWSISPKGWMKN